mmetsp:Transcript_17333/g.47724  ORF Transcript_17333/g.47724 Transcript_17333/m.47724 type:complete len:124 (-) Transcript_17333:792-1163(-)
MASTRQCTGVEAHLRSFPPRMVGTAGHSPPPSSESILDAMATPVPGASAFCFCSFKVFSGMDQNQIEIKELHQDRNPISQNRFPNVVAMREAKLRDWLRVSQSFRFSYHIGCRDFMLDPRSHV